MTAAEAPLTLVPIRRAARRFRGGFLWRGCAAVCGWLVLTSTAGCHGPSVDQPASAIIELTEATFQREVIESEQPVLVEFWAPWCRPCVEMMPAMEQVAQEFSGRAKVAKIRIDENEEIASIFDVASPPGIIVFSRGQVVKRRFGKQTKGDLMRLVAAAVSDGDPQAVEDP